MTKKPTIPPAPGMPSMAYDSPGFPSATAETGVPATQPPPAYAPPQQAADVQAATQHEVAARGLKEKPPLQPYIKRSQFERHLITVHHKEIAPEPFELEMNKYTFGIRNAVGRLKGQLQGVIPDPDAEFTCEYQAVVTVGFKWPVGEDGSLAINPANFTDENLMAALYREVNVFWDLFRKPN